MVLTSQEYLQKCFFNHTQNVNLAVVEGVMGLFDGAAEPAGYGSTAQVAKLLQLPTLLVLNCSSLSQSIAAMVHGYRSLDPELKLAGVILNRVGSDRHLEILEAALAPLQVPVLGVFRREDEIALPDRHLGLVPTAELPELDRIVDRLAALGRDCFNWELLQPLLGIDQQPYREDHDFVLHEQNPLRIAVASDRAFSFYYADNLELLTKLGAELVYWSPLEAEKLPEEIHGFYFGGGFPEMFAAQLADNQSVLSSVKRLIHAGLPTYAECGGLMYLSEAIVDFESNTYPMVGIIPTQTIMGKRLTLGYRSALALAQTPLLAPNHIVRGHEFHRSSTKSQPNQPLYKMQRSANLDRLALTSAHSESSLLEGWHSPTFHISYLHLHWGATPELPLRWLQHCQKYSQKDA